jgi:hypothetical protein
VLETFAGDELEVIARFLERLNDPPA